MEQDGYEQDVDSLSGGEKTGVALAFRLALNSTMREQAALPGTNIIILDEPTDGFSRDQMQKVSDILKSIDSNQIIMVSHERELEDYAEHRFRVTKTDGVGHRASSPLDTCHRRIPCLIWSGVSTGGHYAWVISLRYCQI